jgi:hypothetical protein
MRQTLNLTASNPRVCSVSLLSGLCYRQLESITIDRRVSAYRMHPYSRRRGVPGKRAVMGVCWPLLCCKLQNPATQTHGITADLASWVSRYVVTGA